MPVNILDIPSEKKTVKKPPSLWLWGLILLCFTVVYVFVFLLYFPQYLSKNNYILGLELILLPLLIWGGVFFFRVIAWNNEYIEAIDWNKTRGDFYQEILSKGRIALNVRDLKIKVPDINGDISNVVNNSLLPVRYTPDSTLMARYLAFDSTIINKKEYHGKLNRKISLFNELINELIDDIYLHLSLLPKLTKVNVVCALDSELSTMMQNIWDVRFKNNFPSVDLQFSESLLVTIDSYLDDHRNEFVVFVFASLFDDHDLSGERIKNKSESVMLLFGERCNNEKDNVYSLGCLFRPENDWQGIDKSLIWGCVPEKQMLSGVIYSGLNDQEKNKLILKTSGFMSESALSSYSFIDTDDLFCTCPPLTEFLQFQYLKENKDDGCYLIVNKNDDLLTSYFITLKANESGEI